MLSNNSFAKCWTEKSQLVLYKERYLGRYVNYVFSSYLSCRSQHVLVGHALSAETPLFCGVPQGSVLGPFLFSLYTRQLADLIDKFCIDSLFCRRFRTVLVPTNWTWVCSECVEKCWVVLSTDKNMDDEKQIETQWAKNWSTPLWTII